MTEPREELTIGPPITEELNVETVVPCYAGFMQQFRRNANGIALRYGAPVYLVGGAVVEVDPRDYDVRIILDEAGLRFLYGRKYKKERTEADLFEYASWEWLRAYDQVKLSRIMSARMAWPVDVQIETELEAEVYKLEPRVRLDAVPDRVLRAGLKATARASSPSAG